MAACFENTSRIQGDAERIMFRIISNIYELEMTSVVL